MLRRRDPPSLFHLSTRWRNRGKDRSWIRRDQDRSKDGNGLNVLQSTFVECARWSDGEVRVPGDDWVADLTEEGEFFERLSHDESGEKGEGGESWSENVGGKMLLELGWWEEF